MLIRYIFGPRAGETEHVDRTTAKPLLVAQIAEAVNPEDLKDPNDGVVRVGNETYRLPRSGDARVPAPKWSLDLISVRAVGKHPAQKILVIRMDILGQSYKWFGEPKNANVQVKWNGGLRYLNGFGRPVPEEILKDYTQRWKSDESLRAPQELLHPEREKASGSTPPWEIVAVD